jgi:hypothetical protein
MHNTCWPTWAQSVDSDSKKAKTTTSTESKINTEPSSDLTTEEITEEPKNDWSLNIMVIAWYHPAEYWDMQEWLQRTCLEILGRFNDEGIDFAFPSRTLYLANDDKRRLSLKMLKGETVTYAPEGDCDE